jgi:hypothetical protein
VWVPEIDWKRPNGEEKVDDCASVSVCVCLSLSLLVSFLARGRKSELDVNYRNNLVQNKGTRKDFPQWSGCYMTWHEMTSCLRVLTDCFLCKKMCLVLIEEVKAFNVLFSYNFAVT